MKLVTLSIIAALMLTPKLAHAQQPEEPNETDILAEAMVKAMAQMKQLEMRLEEQELAKLPDILNCQDMGWMRNCKEINRQAKKNPSVPLRVYSKDGLEFNFVPGTPSAVIRHQLELSKESAKELIKWHDESYAAYEKAGNVFNEALWDVGGYTFIPDMNEIQARFDAKDFDSTYLSITTFVESTCRVCDTQLENLAQLKERYPNLKIQVFQMDDDRDAFERKVRSQGFSGRIVTDKERKHLMANMGITAWPITWVDNTNTKRREIMMGNKTMLQFESVLIGLSKAAPLPAGAKK